MENRRAGIDLGHLSPYPTVVIDMKLHHIPSNQPRKKVRGNSSWLPHVSVSQQMKPDMQTCVAQLYMFYTHLNDT